MARIVEKRITFDGSTSPDVTGYRLYYEVSPSPITYDSPSIDVAATDTLVTVELHVIPEFIDFDDVYNIGVSAVDDIGNESDMSLLNDVPLDLAPPTPPGPLQLV